VNIFIASLNENLAVLNEEESWHCSRVLRRRQGETVRLIDGKGTFMEGTLGLVTDKRCEVQVEKTWKQAARPYYLHLAIAPTKQIDRVEWMLEKAVEIGIDECSFIICKNSERTSIKMDRMQKIVEGAVKQSLQAYVPKLNDAENFSSFIGRSFPGQGFLAHCEPGGKTPIPPLTFNGNPSLIVVGPEGDFTSEEIRQAQQKGFKGLDLGPNRLRTETAGLYVCQAASIIHTIRS